MKGRRDILDTALGGQERSSGITLAAPKKRNRRWDKTHPTHSYRGIPSELHQEILKIAKELKVSPGEIARAFMDYALQAYRNGDLPLQPTMRPGKFTLFPDEE